MRLKRIGLAAAACVVLGMSACGGEGENEVGQTFLRAFHLAQNQGALTFSSQGGNVGTAELGELTGYSSVFNLEGQTLAQRSDSEAVAEGNLNPAANSQWTLAIIGNTTAGAKSYRLVNLEEGISAPTAGKFKVRVFQAASRQSANLDVYLSSPLDVDEDGNELPLSVLKAAFSNVEFSNVTAFKEITFDEPVRLRITPNGDRTTVLVDIDNLNVSQTVAQTLVIKDSASGGSTPTVVLIDDD